MRCDEIRDRLSDYLDGELAGEERQQVHAHLESCSACRNELDMLREVIAGVKELPDLKAPDEFAESVMNRIKAPEPAVVSRPTLRFRVFWPIAAALLIAVVVHMMTQQPAKEQPALTRDLATRSDSDSGGFSRAETIGAANAAPVAEMHYLSKADESAGQRDNKIGENRGFELNGAIALDERTRRDPLVDSNAFSNYRREPSRRVEGESAVDGEKKEAEGISFDGSYAFENGPRADRYSMTNVAPDLALPKAGLETAPGKGAGIGHIEGGGLLAKQLESGVGGMQILQEQRKDGVLVVTVPSENPQAALTTAVAFARSNEWIPPAETAAAELRVQERSRLVQSGRAQLPGADGKLGFAHVNQLLIRLNEKELAELLAAVRVTTAKPLSSTLNQPAARAQAPLTQQQRQFSATQQSETQQSQRLARGQVLDQQLPLTDYLIVFVPDSELSDAVITAEEADAARASALDEAATETEDAK